MGECLQPADDFYNNPNEFSTVDKFLTKSIEKSTENEVKGILGLFIGKEKQLSDFIESKIKCSNDDDKMQLGMLKQALYQLSNINNNTRNNLNDLNNNLTESNEWLSNIDFRITDVIAYFGSREYKQNIKISPSISHIKNNIYEITLNMYRNSKSSLRGNEDVTLSFKYDGYELIFFNNKNNDGKIDSNEGGKKYILGHKQETRINGNRIYNQSVNKNIDLKENAITERGVKNINFTLVFNK